MFLLIVFALALVSVSGVGMARVLVVVAFMGLKRVKYESCGFLCLIELSSKICAAWGCFLI